MDSSREEMEQRRRWPERQHLARLCDNVAVSLLSHLEPERPTQLSREDERGVLVALARVNKAIRRWDEEEEEQVCESDQEAVSCSEEAHSCCLPPDQLFDDGFSCLANIVSILVYFWHEEKRKGEASQSTLGLCIQSYRLVHSGNDSRPQCSCKRDEFCHNVQGCTDHCNCFGLSEISDWFHRCCLDKIFNSNSSADIVLCFLQLYMEEDDMLFIILLKLLDAPLISLEIDNMETKWTSELIGAKLLSIIFDPVHIFHLLLSLLHYDHLLLVDYLISKDVGVYCAQYLLRCLRLVSQCWDAFVDDSVYKAKIQKLNYKR